MTDDDDITVVPMKELTRLRRVDAAARAFRDVCAARALGDRPGAPRNKDEEEEEILLMALDIAFMTEEELLRHGEGIARRDVRR